MWRELFSNFRSPVFLWLGVLIGVVCWRFRSKKKNLFQIQPTTIAIQNELVKENVHNNKKDNFVQVSPLSSSIPLSMCVPFRSNNNNNKNYMRAEENVSFPQVGGKGLSLLKMAHVPNINVPNGFVLPVSFFEAWTQNVRESDEFQQFLESLHVLSSSTSASLSTAAATSSTSMSNNIKITCQNLKTVCLRQKLTLQMRAAIVAGLDHIQATETSLVAVRSSSPEEDLVASSFAGGYETVLGVRSDVESLQSAIAQVFASCYDERVFVYKTAQGFKEAAKDPQIAVVIQLQVHAKAAGVAFSLHPLYNDQDVCLINACFGLGESVVSGLTSPDEFEVRHDQGRVPPSIIKRVLGKKELSVHLGKDGGTVHKHSSSNSEDSKITNTTATENKTSGEYCISDALVLQITRELLTIVEVYGGRPMDTEWGVDEQGHLLWLQARPITAHFQVPKNMATKPGEQKYLYVDVLSTVQGIQGGVSILGCDLVAHFLNMTIFTMVSMRAVNRGPAHSLVLTSGRSAHANISNLLLIGGEKRITAGINQMDMLVARTFQETNLSSYLPPSFFTAVTAAFMSLFSSHPTSTATATFPPFFGLLPLRVLWSRPQFVICLLQTWINPSKSYSQYEKTFQTFWKELEEIQSSMEVESKQSTHASESPVEFSQRVLGSLVDTLTKRLIPTMVCGRLLHMQLNALVNKYQPGDEEQRRLSVLAHGLPGNITLELGERCEDLAVCLEQQQLWSKAHNKGDLPSQLETLYQVILKNSSALALWQKLLSLYGHRSSDREFDIETPKYYDLSSSSSFSSASLLVNVLRIFDLSLEVRPHALQKRLSRERKDASVFLHSWLERVAGVAEAKRFDGLFAGYERLGGLRETHKYLLIKALYLCRLRYLREGRWHHAAGRLDSPEDVFGLTLGDLEGAWQVYDSITIPNIITASMLDLRGLLNARRVTARKAGDPKLFDSRGLELRAKPPLSSEGVYVGFPVSAGPGPVVGRTKTLRSPDEKPLLEGEILVARATDPGWTPLFVPAAAVVLEVGGPLQHGALVAREYGKPCVVGIENVVDLFPDGTLVKVNGILGTVELMEEPPL